MQFLNSIAHFDRQKTNTEIEKEGIVELYEQFVGVS